MKIKARMEGTEFSSGRIILTPITSALAMSNTWRFEINRLTGDLVLDRNGLTIEANVKNIPTVAAEEMTETEKAALQMFCVLYFERYLSTQDEHAPTLETELEVDDHIGRYLLDPVLTTNLKPLIARGTRLFAVTPPMRGSV